MCFRRLEGRIKIWKFTPLLVFCLIIVSENLFNVSVVFQDVFSSNKTSFKTTVCNFCSFDEFLFVCLVSEVVRS